MAAKLGEVLYVVAKLTALLALGLAVYLLSFGMHPFGVGVLVVFAFVVWLVGRRIKYALAGR